MNFRIADSFTASLSRLTNDEQKAVKTTAFDLQMNPASPGLSFHKLDRAKDPNFWSVRVSRDLRLIVHRTASSLLLAYVGHHDDAYAWAERRKLTTHPKTGAAQIVEIRERVEEITVYRTREEEVAPIPKAPLLDGHAEDELLSYGVPEEWLDDVLAATEDNILDIATHLPSEAAEAILNLATGTTPELVTPSAPEADPFQHPDALRRFRVLTNREELERALEFPWEQWTVFLHPVQRRYVERDYTGPVRVSGSAGTGKTVVALHRAVRLARTHLEASVLLTTFNQPLANALKLKLERLAGNEPDVMQRITVEPLRGIGEQLYQRCLGSIEIAETDVIRAELHAAADEIADGGFGRRFIESEWETIVDAWGIRDWETYREVPRLGRKTRIGGKQRETLWAVFQKARERLDARGLITWSDLFTRLAEEVEPAFDFIVVDEAQDISVAELRFLARQGGRRPDSLFFAGDLGQRIFRQPFSWKTLGIDLRGRSHTLRVNYRTSHQIRAKADRLLPKTISDVDGNEESRSGTVSVFNGADPEIEVLESSEKESAHVAKWIGSRINEGYRPNEIGVFVRSEAELDRAVEAIALSGATPVVLSEKTGVNADHVPVGTMHAAKGLEFRAVVAMACDDEVLPLSERIETATDESDLEDVYNTERHLLYVACTRARDRLLVTGVEPASEFLDDIVGR